MREIRNLARLNFIENNKNLIFIGNSGIEKTHLATAIGRLAASSRYSTYFIKCHDLIANLKAGSDSKIMISEKQDFIESPLHSLLDV